MGKASREKPHRVGAMETQNTGVFCVKTMIIF